MKKLIAALLTAAMLLSLTACANNISKILNPPPDAAQDPEAVQPKEPEIPDQAPSGGEPSTQPMEPAPPTDSVEPVAPQPEPDDTPAGTDEDQQKPDVDITASHSDVTLFSAGETFTMSARGISGVYAGSFVSANPEVASVDETTGLITAVAPGMTTVTMHVECGAGQFDFDCIVRCRWDAEEPGLPDGGTGTQPDGQPPVPPVSGATSLSDFFSTLQGQYKGLGTLMVMDGQLLDSYYPGLTDIASVEEVLIQETTISISNVAVGLVRLSDDASAEDILAVQNILQSRITAQAEGGAFYPAACEAWENGVITSVSNCVGMFVSPDDAHPMADLFTDTFSS